MKNLAGTTEVAKRERAVEGEGGTAHGEGARWRVISGAGVASGGVAADGGVRPAALISPVMDALLIGGASILLLALMSVMLRHEAPDSTLGWFVFSLSFAVNFPHFLVSYQLLYIDFGKKILREPRFFWAGVAVPVLLIAVLGAGFLSGSPRLLGYLASSMFFFVGWHYVKQIFGGITVSNALQKFYFNKIERMALKTNLVSLWAISFLGSNIGPRSYVQDGISYGSFELPEWTMSAAYACLWASLAAVFVMTIQKYVRKGRWPSPTATVCFLTIYAWYLPLLKHPMFMHMIPFFHSLQYLTFVYVFRRNKMDAQVEGRSNTPEGRLEKLTGVWGYLSVAAVTGALAMYIVPRTIDGLHWQDERLFGMTAAYFAFQIFINVHHYFIDNVIWRGNNGEMKQYLFRA